MNLSKGLLPSRLLSLQACILIAASTAAAQVAPAPADSTAPASSTTTSTVTTAQVTSTTTASTPAQSATAPVVLSPFEVVSDTKGYYSANTEAGTRPTTSARAK